MPKFAANLGLMFIEAEFLDRFEAAADAGFKAVECIFPYAYSAAEVKQRLDDHDLMMAKFNLPPGDSNAGDFGLTAVPGRESEFRESVGKAIEYARLLACPQLHALAGLAPEGRDPTKCMETYVENLSFAAAHLAEHGIRLLIEAVNTRDFPGYFLSHTAQALEVLDTVTSENLFLQYDVYHAQIMEGDLAETIRANIDVIRHFQIAGVPGRHEPDVGEINYRFLFDLIDSLGYEDWIGCEYHPRAGTVEGLGWANAYGIG
jgi:hydroxypyruvate isomerase